MDQLKGELAASTNAALGIGGALSSAWRRKGTGSPSKDAGCFSVSKRAPWAALSAFSVARG